MKLGELDASAPAYSTRPLGLAQRVAMRASARPGGSTRYEPAVSGCSFQQSMRIPSDGSGKRAAGGDLQRLEDRCDALGRTASRSSRIAGAAPTKQVSAAPGMPDRPLVHRAAGGVGDRRQERPRELAPPRRRERDVGLDDVTGAQRGERREPVGRAAAARSPARATGPSGSATIAARAASRVPSRSSSSTPVALVLDAEHRRAERRPAARAARRGRDRERRGTAGDAPREPPGGRPAPRLLGGHREQRHLGGRHRRSADRVHRLDERERAGVAALRLDPAGEADRVERARALALPGRVGIDGARRSPRSRHRAPRRARAHRADGVHVLAAEHDGAPRRLLLVRRRPRARRRASRAGGRTARRPRRGTRRRSRPGGPRRRRSRCGRRDARAPRARARRRRARRGRSRRSAPRRPRR